jgi:D-tyrosyl-tRNA(Tyr) deacylase
MKIVLQRVKRAKVDVNGKPVGQIGEGLLVFLGVMVGDSEKEVDTLCDKMLKLRIFENENNKFDKSLMDIKGEILVIPQFTLLAYASKGNRPYFGEAEKPELAKQLFEIFVEELRKSGLKIENGHFGAKMEIESTNDGPVTIILEEKGSKNGQN